MLKSKSSLNITHSRYKFQHITRGMQQVQLTNNIYLIFFVSLLQTKKLQIQKISI